MQYRIKLVDSVRYVPEYWDDETFLWESVSDVTTFYGSYDEAYAACAKHKATLKDDAMILKEFEL